MIIARERMTDAAHKAAAEIARRLGMHEHEDIDTLKPNQSVMIASASGIKMGTLTTRNMVNMRYTAYKINGETLWEKRYLFNNTKKLAEDSTPTTKIFFDEDAVVYVADSQ